MAAEFTKALQQVLEGPQADPQEFDLGSVAIYEARFLPDRRKVRSVCGHPEYFSAGEREERLRETSSLSSLSWIRPPMASW